ncbi:hypothetical protein ANCDUO_13166 [Ancylostoma duodenale]|uniref:Uncharacterized protein n=1 Tax=Ancylostoma duodenale TaxID=51022 RepID=A0A0C2GCP0_9BILA|nr:hypothetical protein ANCDUO_13166 [Ancylostoma duodenale]
MHHRYLRTMRPAGHAHSSGPLRTDCCWFSGPHTNSAEGERKLASLSHSSSSVNLNDWGPDVFKIDELSKNHALTAITYALFRERGLIKSDSMDIFKDEAWRQRQDIPKYYPEYPHITP